MPIQIQVRIQIQMKIQVQIQIQKQDAPSLQKGPNISGAGSIGRNCTRTGPWQLMLMQ